LRSSLLRCKSLLLPIEIAQSIAAARQPICSKFRASMMFHDCVTHFTLRNLIAVLLSPAS
jgi:hypothetical protein